MIDESKDCIEDLVDINVYDGCHSDYANSKQFYGTNANEQNANQYDAAT